MYKLNKIMIMILNKDNKWIHAEPEEQRELFEYLNKLVKDNAKKTSKMPGVEQAEDILKFEIMHYNKIVGFIGYEKSNRFLAFKTKNMLSKRDTGAICTGSGKEKPLKKLNEILGENKYTKENTKAEKDSDGNVIRQAIGNVELCVLQEFILRYFNTIKREDKKWFLTPEMALWHKIYTVFA